MAPSLCFPSATLGRMLALHGEVGGEGLVQAAPRRPAGGGGEGEAHTQETGLSLIAGFLSRVLPENHALLGGYLRSQKPICM